MFLLLTVVGGLALGGCVAGMVAGAAGTAVQAARAHSDSNAHLQPIAKTACTVQADRYGVVHIIDVEQRSVNKIVVWGTIGEGEQQRSFECGFRTAITYFKVRPIRARR